MSETTFVMPPHGIMCFHCGETFMTYGAARDHFGATRDAEPGCLIQRVPVEKGGTPETGRGLLMALRTAEHERDEWRTRALRAEMFEEMHGSLCSSLQRQFGTSCPRTIAMRLDDERFRADHAMRRLSEAGVAFDASTQDAAS